jgi:hypothetical protein
MVEQLDALVDPLPPRLPTVCRSTAKFASFLHVSGGSRRAVLLARSLNYVWHPAWSPVLEPRYDARPKETDMKRTFVIAAAFVLLTAMAASAQSTPAPSPAPQAPRVGTAFVDANGDGICDNFQNGTRQGTGQGQARMRGRRLGPQDGSGFGAGSGTASGSASGTGLCDGTGPKGRGMGRGRR